MAASSSARCFVAPFSALTISLSPRRLARTRSAVSIVLPTSIVGPRLCCIRRHDLVQAGAFAFLGPQNAPKALHVFSHATASADHDRHIGFRHVDSLVEHLRSDYSVVTTLRQTLQNFASLCHLGLVRDDSDQKAS